MIALTCAHCDKEFMAYPSRLKAGRKLCSAKCQAAFSRRTTEQAFNALVSRSANPDECWGWNGGLRTRGYGSVNLWKDGRRVTDGIHRVAFRLYVGPIPPGMFVLHRCDNPVCSNPNHLFLGTHADNMADMVAKGRHKHPQARLGEKNHKSKLSADMVLAIRASKEASRVIAKRYGITHQSVLAIRRHENWRHIP